jgi:hypothetical protein
MIKFEPFGGSFYLPDTIRVAYFNSTVKGVSDSTKNVVADYFPFDALFDAPRPL